MVRYIQKLYQIAPEGPYRPSSEAEWTRIVSYIQIVGAAMTAWLTWGIKSIIVFITAMMNLPMGKTTSMALNPSGPLQNGGL